MRYLKIAFLIVVGVLLLVIAIANREAAQVKLLPTEVAEFAGWNFILSLPLFAIILASIVLGVVLGYVFEWLREHKHRAAATRHRKRAQKLEREVDAMKGPNHSDDDVLAILDNRSTAG